MYKDKKVIFYFFYKTRQRNKPWRLNRVRMLGDKHDNWTIILEEKRLSLPTTHMVVYVSRGDMPQFHFKCPEWPSFYFFINSISGV